MMMARTMLVIMKTTMIMTLTMKKIMTNDNDEDNREETNGMALLQFIVSLVGIISGGWYWCYYLRASRG